MSPWSSDGVVSTETWKLLEVCDHAIKKAKKLIRFGAGNQIHDVLRTKGESVVRTLAACEILEDISAGEAVAPACLLTRGGNCEPQARVVHDLLREMLSAEYHVGFAVAKGMDHIFALAWREGEEKDAVAADSWPIRAQAVLLRDHFCTAGGFRPPRMVRRCGKGYSLLKRRLSKLRLLDDTPVYGRDSAPPGKSLERFTPETLEDYFRWSREDIDRCTFANGPRLYDFEKVKLFNIYWSSSQGRQLHYECRAAKRALSP